MDADKQNQPHTPAKRDDILRDFVLLPIAGGVGQLLTSLAPLLGKNHHERLLHLVGYEDADRHWPQITSAETFEAGFVQYARTAESEGWGYLTLVSLDRNASRAVIRLEMGEVSTANASNTPWGKHLMGGKLAGLCAKHFQMTCRAEIHENGAGLEYVITPSGDATTMTLADALAQSCAESMAINETLTMLKQEVIERRDAEENLKFEVAERKLIEESLKFEVEERAQMEQELRQKLRVIVEQQEAIHRMSVPIIQVWDGVLAVPMIGPLSEQRAAEMTEKLLHELAKTQAHDVIIDVTGAEFTEALTAEHVLRIIQAVELMGARGLITGIQPTAARAMISAGVDLGRIKALGNLREGLKECMKPERKRR